MARVYLARQTDLDRDVALKELAAFHVSYQAFARRFVRESRVAGSLSHPNVVTVHEYFEHDGTPYIDPNPIQNPATSITTTTCRACPGGLWARRRAHACRQVDVHLHERRARDG
jgi:serine/threonine protein kinase